MWPEVVWFWNPHLTTQHYGPFMNKASPRYADSWAGARAGWSARLGQATLGGGQGPGACAEREAAAQSQS